VAGSSSDQELSIDDLVPRLLADGQLLLLVGVPRVVTGLVVDDGWLYHGGLPGVGPGAVFVFEFSNVVCQGMH